VPLMTFVYVHGAGFVQSQCVEVFGKRIWQ